ncbi:Bacteriophage head to tail connecting protein [Rhizobiales bacterium GAS113]|nr:Bacteriophage head to tail connecting protein [Rhizobiales bacterium GAS113]
MADYDQQDRSKAELNAAKGKNKHLAGEGVDRLAKARYQKTQFELDLREGYWFAAPHRARNVLSTTKTTRAKPKDAQELNTSFAFELCGDFPTVMINTFLPQVQQWFVRKPSMIVPEEAKQKIADDARDGDAKIFQAILGSNFYAECGKGFNPDLALGTVAMWIEARKGYEPVRCQAIPIRELEINVGPYGDVDDRFVVRYTEYRHLAALLPGIDLPAKITTAIKKKPTGDCVVVWGFWRLYKDDGDEYWQHVVMVDSELVHSAELKGVGCCPLIVARFNPSPEWAWGVGSLIQALPDLRSLDELAMKKIKSIDMTLMPPTGYPDDSFTHVEQGIEAGMAYPVRPGSESAIKAIYSPPPQDPAIYFTQDLEQRVKRLFFLDWPQQRGDTPPTATQWLDEMTKAQQRIGTPGLSFWTEFCGGTASRFQYILEKQGVIKPPALDGKAVSLTPYNPAQKSAEQQEVAQAARAIEIVGQAFPEEFKVSVDGAKTIKNIVDKLGADKIIVMRNPEDIKAAVAQIQQLQGGQQASAPPVPGAASAPPADLAGPQGNLPTFDVRSRSNI